MAGKITAKLNQLQRSMHLFFALGPISFLLSKSLHRADSLLLRLTGGRHTFAELVGLPIGKLTTQGARTGKPRSTPLVSVPDGDKFALIATNFGQKHHPAWYNNLRAHPECKLSFKGRCESYLAHEARGQEYEWYWRLACSYYSGYDKYRKRAVPRRIPIVVLERMNS